MLTTQDFLDRGYKRFEDKSGFNTADFGLQKRIDDHKGKKYFITVWAYDWTKYKGIHITSAMSFEPDLSFKLQDGGYINFKLLLDSNSTIDYIESKIQEIWDKLGCQYYEEWE